MEKRCRGDGEERWRSDGFSTKVRVLSEGEGESVHRKAGGPQSFTLGVCCD